MTDICISRVTFVTENYRIKLKSRYLLFWCFNWITFLFFKKLCNLLRKLSFYKKFQITSQNCSSEIIQIVKKDWILKRGTIHSFSYLAVNLWTLVWNNFCFLTGMHKCPDCPDVTHPLWVCYFHFFNELDLSCTHPSKSN